MTLLAIADTAANAQSMIDNAGFEVPALLPWHFQYSPASTWLFKPGAGIAADGSAFTASNAPAPEGRQVAFLQNLGGIEQSVYLPAAGYYSLDFKSAQRAYWFDTTPAQTIRLLVDGTLIGEHRPPTFGYSDSYYTFHAEAGMHTIALDGVANRGDQTAFVDDVVVRPRSWGFWDPGLVDGAVKSGYLTATKGTAADPLSLPTPCLWADDDPLLIANITCASTPNVYATNFAFWQNTSWSATTPYWVYAVNNEPAQNLCNPGPPDLSLPRSSPGNGVAGFVVLTDAAAGENFNRAHLVLNQAMPGNPCEGGITYMSFGAQANRGNMNPIVALNPHGAPSTVRFTAKLWAFERNSPSWLRLVMLSSWPDDSGRWVPRQVQLNLFGGGRDGFVNVHWNWPVQDDFFPHGGADIAIVDADILSSMCRMYVPLLDTAGQQIIYTIDVDAVFHCVSDHGGFSNPLPTTPNIAVYGVHWAVENARPPTVAVPGIIWVSVHGMYAF
jgi:hypothetical protein